ncbi:MAG: metal-dependent hydrolase [Fluviicoccus sp.]|uniref:metal-dependent hydrolase n=1 Tax=Fluviicoccus sp. TaxID=2003552 RepID=UPI0027226C50|nr:metal-dependent hydrolase [Fluviicoccus sp.]MDO8330961.1 metal-dependent hydrolase [Fluviicoccus sp.]
MVKMTATSQARSSSADWAIIPRNISLDWSRVPLQWIYDDRFASLATNGLSYYLIATEFAMCRLCNEALPYIDDPKLREDVRGFIRQESLHARAHGKHLTEFMERHGIEGIPANRFARRLLEEVLVEKPFGKTLPKALKKPWAMFRAGLFAAGEHYTTGFANQLLNRLKWDENGCDPTMSELLHWHAVEEIEHRTVVFDTFNALGGSLPVRVVAMSLLFPVMQFLMVSSVTELSARDTSAPSKKLDLWHPSFWRSWNSSAKAGNVPSPAWLMTHALSFCLPGYNPADEGSTEQAMEYLERMPFVSVVPR